MKATEETKDLAKEAGIKSWHVKSEERLQAELGALNEQIEVVEETSGTVDSAETVIEEVVPVPEKLELPTDVDKKVMVFSIKCRHNLSPYWKYKKLLGM